MEKKSSLESQEQKIAAELIAMRVEDQAMRMSGMFDSAIDIKNTARLKEIIDEFGWPGISQVGEEAAQAAWLLVQHADLDPTFQENMFALMQSQPEGEVHRRLIAQLEDRILVSKGLPQKYGTQFDKVADGRFVPKPIADEEGVAERRQAVGLSTMEASIAIMNPEK